MTLDSLGYRRHSAVDVPAPKPAPPATRPQLVRRESILVKFPTRSRPEKFLRTLENWRSKQSGLHDVRYIISIDTDDATMNNAAMLEKLAAMPSVTVKVGNSKSKVEAINAGMEGEEFDTVILASDDMIVQAQGWDDVVAKDMLWHFPNRDGALHYNDGFRKSTICTLSIMGRNLYLKFGYIYHPDYKSLWCDNEYTDVCKKLNKHVYIDQIIVRHEHPINVRGIRDALMQRNDALSNIDRATYGRRAAGNFEVKKPDISILMTSLPENGAAREKVLTQLNSQIDALADRWAVETHVQYSRPENIETTKNVLRQRAMGRRMVFLDGTSSILDTYVHDLLSKPQEEAELAHAGKHRPVPVLR